jgi:hypothetical protein
MLQIGRIIYAECVTHETAFLMWEREHYRQFVSVKQQ